MFSKVSSALFIVPMVMIASLSFSQANVKQWTLESSVQQAMIAAPELKKSIAEIGARQADVTLAGLWPDPSIEFRVDNKMGQDDGSGGYDLSDITISQAIPLSRTKYQKSVAEARLKATEYTQVHQALLLQNRVSKVFHQLQFATAELSLAEKRLKFADQLYKRNGKNKQDVIVRYLTPLEKMRLSIIREEANQAASNAEGKYYEVLNEFTKLLGMSIESTPIVSELHAIESMPDINQLLALQESHVGLSSQQQQLRAAVHEIEVARNSQMEDPTISLSQSRDTFNSGRENVLGIMFNIQIPIHDRKSTAVSKANYNASQQRIELQRLKREMQINLKRSFTHLNHVVEQTANYQQKVLKPARKMLDLTQKGFTSGELNILSLVDANKTYFEARLRHLDLLYQAWAELADVNLYSGQLITGMDTQDIKLNQGAL
jgi:outer membrane protein, heavy metal efflux system